MHAHNFIVGYSVSRRLQGTVELDDLDQTGVTHTMIFFRFIFEVTSKLK